MQLLHVPQLSFFFLLTVKLIGKNISERNNHDPYSFETILVCLPSQPTLVFFAKYFSITGELSTKYFESNLCSVYNQFLNSLSF